MNLDVYTHVCMGVCVCVCVCMYVRTNICMCTYVCSYVCMHVCVSIKIQITHPRRERLHELNERLPRINLFSSCWQNNNRLYFGLI